MSKIVLSIAWVIILSTFWWFIYADNSDYTVVVCAEVVKDDFKRVTNLYIEPNLPNSPDEYTRISDTCIWLNYIYQVENNNVVPYFLALKVSDYDMNKKTFLDAYTLSLWHEWRWNNGEPHIKTLRYEIIDATFENDIKTVWSVVSVIDTVNGTSNESTYIWFAWIPPLVMNEYIANLYKIWATRYDNNIDFKPEWFITREQAAKFVVKTRSAYNYPNNELGWLDKKECHFSSENIDPSLKSYVYTVCDLGIMKWSQWKFYPKQPLTLWQAVTILTRITNWSVYESNDSLWYKNYFILWYRNNLFAGGGRNPYIIEWKYNVSRWEMAIMINNVLNK